MAKVKKIGEEPIEINSDDAAQLRIKPDTRLRVNSRRGQLIARAHIIPGIKRGQVFIPMHYPETNKLTHPNFDRHSHQPAYKASAVAIDLKLD